MKWTRNQSIGLVIAVVLVFFFLDRAAEYIRGELAAGTPLNTITRDLAGGILRGGLFHLSFSVPDLLVGAAGVFVVVLIAVYRAAMKQNTRPGEEHGSARWAEPKEIAPFRDPNPAKELRFTETVAMSTDSTRTRRNSNVCVFGASGSRKTLSYVVPNLVNIDASTATTDPKGEIYQMTRAALERRGIQVRTLNLIDLQLSDQFNPLRYIRVDDPETDIMQLAEGIITNTDGQSHGADPFWPRAERALLTALIAYVWATQSQDLEQEPNLPAVVDLQKGMDSSEEDKDARHSRTDVLFEAAREAVKAARAHPNADDDPLTVEVLDFACRQYRIYQQGAAETRKGVVISLGARLSPIDTKQMRRILSSDTIHLDKLGYEPTALFLQIPDTHNAFKFVSAMFWQVMFSYTVYQADHEPARRLPRMLHTFLDEFANIGIIPNFEKLIATIRSRGISASLIYQNYAQGKAHFKENWTTILGNCDTKLFLGGDDPETKEYVSKALGNETITANDTSRTRGATGSYSESNRSMGRPLMTPDEVGRLDNDLAIVMIRGVHPFKSRKTTIRTHELERAA